MEGETQTDIGVVTAVAGKKVRVEIQRGGGCKSCSLRGMCFAQSTPAVFELESEFELREGDRVELEIAPGDRVLSAILVFVVPLVFLFGGFMLAGLFLREIFAIGVAFAAMALSFIIIRCIDRRLGKRLQVTIGRKL
jgi:positive regulator of sigma E activity